MLLLVIQSLTKRLNCQRPVVLKDDLRAFCSQLDGIIAEHTVDAITHAQVCFVLLVLYSRCLMFPSLFFSNLSCQ